MPHQCTECGHTFPDGSTDMLSGCPDCGGNKFQYFPGEVPEDPPDEQPPEPAESSMSTTVGKAARTVRDLVGTDTPPDNALDTDDPVDPPSTDTDADSGDTTQPTPTPNAGSSPPTEAKETASAPEDDAQRAARSEVVDSTDLPEPDSGEVIERPSGDRPDMAELREELNDQFESIRIVEPGQYELNLMELYDREEYIIALQENGRYVIEVPDAWHGDDQPPT